ncbi:unnamed protein product [Pseudo-nitzschia multistriata]|uniref:SAP domain-containing protein n=1 Tax=Pseudo-nitzschia multistriata TaxID=183589 RepID=A0A448ZHK3_9STRA|nr:unnamed protein product [Pseudo-nitzschia multistriata]
MNHASKREPTASGGSAKSVTMADFIRFNETSNLAPIRAAVKSPTPAAVSNSMIAKPTTNLSYTVRATKKGNVPCVVESRKHHKVVVLSNIDGDVDALLSTLKKKLGTGGVKKGNTIEINGGGDKQVEAIKRFCVKSGCLKGVSKQTKGAIVEKTSKSAKGTGNKKSNDENTPKPPSSIDPSMRLTSKEIKAMKPNKMKEHLAAWQLSTQGNKKELIARLISASALSTA